MDFMTNNAGNGHFKLRPRDTAANSYFCHLRIHMLTFFWLINSLIYKIEFFQKVFIYIICEKMQTTTEVLLHIRRNSLAAIFEHFTH